MSEKGDQVSSFGSIDTKAHEEKKNLVSTIGTKLDSLSDSRSTHAPVVTDGEKRYDDRNDSPRSESSIRMRRVERSQREDPDDYNENVSVSSTVVMFRRMLAREEELQLQKFSKDRTINDLEENEVTGRPQDASPDSEDIETKSKGEGRDDSIQEEEKKDSNDVQGDTVVGGRDGEIDDAFPDDFDTNNSTEPVSLESLHQYKVMLESLKSENANLQERLEVADARASHTSGIEELLHKSECMVADLEKENDRLHDRYQGQITKIQDTSRREIRRWEKKENELRDHIVTIEREHENIVEDYLNKLKERDDNISSLEASLESVEREVVAYQTKNEVDIKTIREEGNKQRKKWEKKEKELKAELKHMSSKIEKHTEDCVKSAIEPYADKLRNVESQNRKYASEIEEHKNEIERLMEENGSLSERNAVLEDDARNLMKDVDQLKTSFEASENTARILQDENKCMRKESQESTDAVLKKLSSVEKSKDDLERKYREKLQLEESSKDMIMKLETRLRERSDDIKALESRRANQEEAIQRLAETVQSYEKSNSMLQEEKSNLKLKLEKCEAMLEDSEETAKHKGQENSRLLEEAGIKESSLRRELTKLATLLASKESDFEIKMKSSGDMIDSLNEEKSSLEEQLQHIKHKLARNIEDATKREQRADDQEKELKRLSKELRENISVNQSLNSEFGRLKSKLNDAEEKCARLNKIETLYNESETLVAQLEEENLRIRGSNQESINAVTAKMSEQSKRMESDLKAKIKHLQREKDNIRKDLNDKMKTYQNEIIEKERAAVMQKESMASYRSEMRRLITSIDAKLRSNKEEKDRVQKTNKDLEEKVKEKEEKTKRFEEEIGTYKKRIDDQEKDIQGLMKDLEKGKTSNGALREQVASLRGRLFKAEDAATRCSSLETVVEDLRKELSAKERESREEQESLERQAKKAIARKNAMEKELKQNTELLLKIKEKMAKKR